MSLNGKIAVVTGSSRGIGRAIALRLAKDGASVAVNYQKNAEAAAEVVQEIGGEAFAVQGDVGTVAGIRQFFQALDAELNKRQGTTSSTSWSTTPGSAGRARSNRPPRRSSTNLSP